MHQTVRESVDSAIQYPFYLMVVGFTAERALRRIKSQPTSRDYVIITSKGEENRKRMQSECRNVSFVAGRKTVVLFVVQSDLRSALLSFFTKLVRLYEQLPYLIFHGLPRSPFSSFNSVAGAFFRY